MRTTTLSTWLALALISALPACGGDGDSKGGDSGASDADADADADADTDADTDTDTDTDTDPMTAELHGTIVYADGTPAEGATVRMCSLYCISRDADADGKFTFDAMGGDTYAFDAETHVVEDHATLLSFLDLGEEEVRTLDIPVVLPAWSTSQTLTSAGEIEVTDNLIIDADPDGYTAPLGSTDEAKMLAGVSIDPATSGLPLASTESQVFAMWYLGTWNTTVDPAWSFRTTDDSGLEPGTELKIMAADYLGLQWIDGGTATVQADGTIQSDSGSGIPMLSTLVLAQ